MELPEEILIKIFDHLSPKMVKTCCLVCSRWDTIISNSRQIMKKFQLNLEETNSMIQKAKQLNRKHQIIKVKNLNESTMDVISMHNLQSLQISCCKIESTHLAKVLSQLTLLDVFSAKAVAFIDDFGIDDNFKRAKINLKELRIEYCDIDIVEFFDTETLELFEVSSLLTEECDSVINLLKRQKNLKEFGVGGVICENFYQSPEIYKFNFRLKSLKIDKASMKNDQNDPLFKFLLLQKDSLISMKILYPIETIVHKFILENLLNLQHLEMPVSTLSENHEDILNQLPRNRHIESIKFFGILRNLNNAKLVMNLFPNIKYLDLSQITTHVWFMDFLYYISQSFKNLETLKIPNLFNQRLHQSINFPKLKSFSVTKIYDESIYNPFIRRHSSTLENIYIGWTDDNFIKGLTVDEIMNCCNLKHVTISSYSPLVTRMFNKVSSKNKCWILESRIKNNLDLDYIPLIFKFPDDKAIWDDRCRIWSDELIRDFSTIDNYGLNAFVNKYK
ncbi:unnamed protein product [Chironomus riparius]|uniref:F-box domain-containing protein n=1 Tax=Chironomus riparius TaxID=315576 RepID=A0A9N9WN62_9DIPT|nr:unnamed protein product [Chironomus riparius]